MHQLVISLTAMFASLALLIAGSSLLGTLLSVRLSIEGFSPVAVGLVLVFHSVGFVIGTRLVTRVIRRVGQIRSFAAFAAVGCAAALIHPMYVDGVLWSLLRVLTGFCFAGLIVVLESWISGRATNTTRGALLGIYQVVYFSSAALGQFLVGTGAPDAYPVYSLVAILMVLSLVPLSLTRSEAPVMGTVERLRFRELYRLSPSGLMGGLVAGIAVSGFLALGPLYANRIGFDVEAVARYMMFAVLATMLLQWPLGRLSDLLDRRRLLAVLAAVAGGGAAFASLGQFWPPVLYLGTWLAFGIAGCLYPIALSMINDNMEEGNPVAASAGLLFVYGVGTCLGPVFGALLMQITGPAGLFQSLAVTLAALAVYIAWRIRHTPDLPLEEQGPFVGVAAGETAPAILELDPRLGPDDNS